MKDPPVSSPLSTLLRERTVSAVMAGASCHPSSERIRSNDVSVGCRYCSRLSDDHIRPEPIGYDQRS